MGGGIGVGQNNKRDPGFASDSFDAPLGLGNKLNSHGGQLYSK